MPGVWTPLLDIMPRAAKIAWPFIKGAVKKGLGSEEIISAMRAADVLTFRRQDMLALIREAAQGALLRSDIMRWPTDSLLPISRVRESVTKIVAPFSYVLELTLINPDTGKPYSVNRQAHSDQLIPFSKVTEAFSEAAPSSDSSGSLEIVSVQVVDVIRAGAEGVI